MSLRRAPIFITIGAPDCADEASAERFLREFLNDPFVLDANFLLRKFLARKISRRRAAHYALMLQKTLIGGLPPLRVFERELEEKFFAKTGRRAYFAHRYGAGNIAQTARRALADGAEALAFIPLFPQCSQSMTLSARAEALKLFPDAEISDGRGRFVSENSSARFLLSYAENPVYIDAVARSVLAAARGGGFDALLVCFHSVPLSQDAATGYSKECAMTFALLKEKLGGLFEDEKTLMAWQSKMGRGAWLEPSAFDAAKAALAGGARRLLVLSPGFCFDCTETLVELGEDLKARFLNGGGEKCELIACLNASDAQVSLMENLSSLTQ